MPLFTPHPQRLLVPPILLPELQPTIISAKKIITKNNKTLLSFIRNG